MKTPKLHVKCFGCQMNKLDSSLVVTALRKKGFELCEKASQADVILINTCSVRKHAEDRVTSNLGHMKHLKKTRPKIVVAVVGCMAQRVGEDLLEHDAVNIVAGPSHIPQVPEMIMNALPKDVADAATGSKAISVTEKIRQKTDSQVSQELDDFELTYDSDENHIKHQAFVRAMRGCNNFCTYCIVPYVRGPETSRPPQAIIEQIKKLAQNGIQQITLLGQTIDAYHYEAGDKTYRLADLLEMVADIESIKWIHFITSHPGKFDTAIFQAMANNRKVTPYLHIPAQSGSDRILRAMNRGYTAQQYLDLISEARQIVPDVAIASDFIVGFPGETDEDYQATKNLITDAHFKNSFIFKYSPRPGTHATKRLEDNVPAEVKKQRNIELLELQNSIAEEDNKRFKGRTLEVLVEGLSPRPHLNNADTQTLADGSAATDESWQHPQLIARTAHDYIVVFNGPESLAGNFAKVEITDTAALTLFGRLKQS
nr:tRNA (N6-isopentenyl adenosine(37)-C2)-methylthiotransferase MiaB [Anaerohalosphaera lusitana]